MRILLAQAPFRDTFGYSMPPPGLLRLGGELQRLGIDVELEDLAFRLARGELATGSLLCESAARLLLKRGKFHVIGLSVMGATLPAALEIARRLRELAPHVRLLLGGPGTTGADRLIIERFPWIDVVVRGEAERSLPNLLRALSQDGDLAGLEGMTWRDTGGQTRVEANQAVIEDLTELAPYARDLLPALSEYKRITGAEDGLVPLDSGRGCVFDCSFCTIGRYWERRSRPLPAAQLVEEVHALEQLPGARNAYLCHDIFGADRAHAVEFCQAMIERGVRPWECRSRVDHLDRDLLQLMGRAGCYRVLLGIESGSPKVRAMANKGQYGELDVSQALDDCLRAGVRPILSMILGLPGEGPGELEMTLDLVARASLAGDVLISLHLPNPQIGCGLYETHGRGARPIPGIAPDMAFGSGESAPELALIEAHPDLFSSWAMLPGDDERILQLAQISKLFPEVLSHYPRTWCLLRERRGLTHEELFWAWQASDVEFEQFASNTPDGLTLDALLWEQTVIEQDRLPQAPRMEAFDLPRASWVQSRAKVVCLKHDICAVQQKLAQMAPSTALGEDNQFAQPTWLAISKTENGVASDRISPAVGALMQHLSEPRPVCQLEEQWPNVRGALQALGHAGLLTSHALPNGEAE